MAFIQKIKNNFLKFLLKGFLFLIVLIILDFSIGSILRYFYFKQDSGFLYRTSYAIDSTKAQILIFGSSTANHHYYPEAFEKRLNKTFYNTGRDGNSVFYSYAVLESDLDRYTPNTVILDFNLGEFQEKQDSYDRMSSLLPYCKKHPRIKSIAELRGPYEKFKMLSQIYPFNSLIFAIAIGNIEYNKTREYMNDDHGYVPLTRVWTRKIATDYTVKRYSLDTNMIKVYKSFITDCINSKIKLYIVVSPGYLEYTAKEPSIEIARKIANEFSVPFFDYSKDTFFWKNPKFFANENHLNNTGARVFSNKVIDKIISYEQKLSSSKTDLGNQLINKFSKIVTAK